ncbi:MAG: PilZ domain-containing protein [Acidobacteriia bacterium]|nr:PilZ domain-containing protein [Terriglobia bacterium]
MSQDDAKSGGITAERERRQKARREQLLYLELGPENGGVVLDLSESGIRFQAVSPLREGARVHFRIDLDETRHLEGYGQLAWTDETGRIAGLSFTELSDTVRRQIRGYLLQPAGTRVAAIEDAKKPPGNKVERLAVPEFLLESRPPRNPWLDPENVGRAVRAMLLVTLVATLGVALFAGRREIGGTLAGLGGTIAQRASAWRTAAGKAPERPARATPVMNAGNGKRAADTPPAKEAPPVTPGNAGSSVASAAPVLAPVPVPAPVDIGEAEVTAAQQILRRGKEMGNPAEAVGLLWAAVEKGNTHAELLLADLYLQGLGVAKNCDQARVLLTAAAKKYKEAREQLALLDETGCP